MTRKGRRRVPGFLITFEALSAIVGVIFFSYGYAMLVGMVSRSPWDSVGPGGPIATGLVFLAVALIVEVQRRREQHESGTVPPL